MTEAGRAIAQQGEPTEAAAPRDGLWPGALLAAFVAAAIAAGLALRLWIAWQDVADQATRVLQDDAFYYFLTAERITEGQGISFDGVTTSNGYHPLWLFFLVPFFLLPGRSLPIQAALTGSALLDVAAAGLVALAVGRLTGNKPAALAALLFYLFIPRNVFNGVNGLETAIASFMLAALLLIVVTVWREPQPDWRRWAALTGLVGGLAVLARLEAALVVVGLLALLALYQRGARRWQAPGLALAVSALTVAPWFLWGAVAAGSALPVSGEAATWLTREHFYAGNENTSFADQLEHGWNYTEDVFRRRLPNLYFPDRWLAWATLGVTGLLAAHVLVLAPRDLRRRALAWAPVVALPLAAFVATLLVHTLYRWFFRDWYFAWGMPLLALLAGVLFAYLSAVVSSLAARWRPALALPRDTPAYALLAVVLAAGVAGYVGPGQAIWTSGRLAHQQDRLDAARYFQEHTEPDARVAAFNAGVLAYFSERMVFNIDGVVNPDAYDALREHKLLAYLRSADVQYVADRDQAWRVLHAFITPEDWSQSLWGEDPNASMVREAEIGRRLGIFGQMTIFRIER